MLQIENTPDLVNMGNRGHLDSLKVVEGQNHGDCGSYDLLINVFA